MGSGITLFAEVMQKIRDIPVDQATDLKGFEEIGLSLLDASVDVEHRSKVLDDGFTELTKLDDRGVRIVVVVPLC